MAVQTQTEAEEMRLHREAYLLLFEGILKKRFNDPAAVASALGELRTFVEQRVSTPDSIIDFIPPLARKLAMREDQLGAYIGQNFLKALAMARDTSRQDATAKKGKAIPTDALAQDGPILEAILTAFGAFVQGPDHFEMLDNGGVKLIRKGKEILPASYSDSAEDAADFANVTATDSADMDEPGEVAAAPRGASPAGGKPAALAAREEKSVLAEILERYGSILDIQAKLIPQDFTEEGEEFVVEENAGSSAEEGDLQEPLLIEEILKRFGSILSVHEKLVPVEYSGDDEEEALFGGGEDDGEAQSSPEDVWGGTEPEVERIPVFLTTFAAIRSKLADFQKRQDRSGYQEYLAGATDEVKATLALMNLSARVQKQPDLSVEDELYRLSATMPYSVDQLREFFQRMERLSRNATLVNEFLLKVRQANPAIQSEVRKVWKQILDLLDDDPGEAVARQRSRIILLAVNPAVKPSIESGIMSLIGRLYSL